MAAREAEEIAYDLYVMWRHVNDGKSREKSPNAPQRCIMFII
jgi:hypothetical protein